MELVVGQLALADVVPAALVVPVGERVRLPELVLLVPADLRRVRAGRRLVAAQAGDPGVEPAERAAERLDLADRAAEVGLALPERVAVQLAPGGRATGPRRPRPSCRSAARPRARRRRSRGRARACRARRRARRVEREQHVEQHRLLLLEGAGERDAAREGLEERAEDLLRASSPRSRAQEAAAGSPPSSTSFSVSPRSPRRSVSSGITSSGGMLPRFTFGPKCLTNQAWLALVGASQIRSCEVDLVRDLVDEAGPHLAGRPEDAGGAALAALGDHLPGAGRELLLDPLDPLVRGEDDLGVLRADLGEDGEVAGEVGDQLELALARDVDRPVGDLDVVEAELLEPATCTRRACPCA